MAYHRRTSNFAGTEQHVAHHSLLIKDYIVSHESNIIAPQTSDIITGMWHTLFH